MPARASGSSGLPDHLIRTACTLAVIVAQSLVIALRSPATKRSSENPDIHQIFTTPHTRNIGPIAERIGIWFS